MEIITTFFTFIVCLVIFSLFLLYIIYKQSELIEFMKVKIDEIMNDKRNKNE